MTKREQIINGIVEQIESDLYEKAKKDYHIEYDEYGFDNASIGIQFGFEFGNGNCDVECSVSWNGKGVDMECLLYGTEGHKEKCYKSLSCLEEAVNNMLAENLDTDDLLDAIKEDYREACADEWQTHGFASEADYYHWRYG